MSLKDQAYNALKEMIAAHRFSAGRRVNVEQVAAELGVSRTPVAQALQELEKEGLVVHVPNKGVVLAEMTPAMAEELYLVRGMLEGLAAELAATRLPPRAQEELERILAEQKDSVQRGDSLGYSKSDFRFHAIIYESCQNWILTELLNNIKTRTRPMVRDISPILPELWRDHLAVLEAFRQQDPAGARAAMVRHNQRMANYMRTMQEVNLPAAETPAPKRARV